MYRKCSKKHNYIFNVQGVSVHTNVSATYMFRPLLYGHNGPLRHPATRPLPPNNAGNPSPLRTLTSLPIMDKYLTTD